MGLKSAANDCFRGRTSGGCAAGVGRSETDACPLEADRVKSTAVCEQRRLGVALTGHSPNTRVNA
jgi:hypothetical protein